MRHKILLLCSIAALALAQAACRRAPDMREGGLRLVLRVPTATDAELARKHLAARFEKAELPAIVTREADRLRLDVPGSTTAAHMDEVRALYRTGGRLTLHEMDGETVRPPELSGPIVRDAHARADAGGTQIWIEFHPDAAARFAALTARLVHRKLAIVLDGKTVTTPIVVEPIRTGKAVLTWSGPPEEARAVALALRFPLPQLELESENIVPRAPR